MTEKSFQTPSVMIGRVQPSTTSFSTPADLTYSGTLQAVGSEDAYVTVSEVEPDRPIPGVRYKSPQKPVLMRVDFNGIVSYSIHPPEEIESEECDLP